MSAVWDNRIVSDDAVNRCVSILRQILSPENKSAYIETLVRKGYLAHFPPAPVKEPAKTPPPRRRKIRLVAALALLGLSPVILIIFFALSGRQSTPEAGASQGDSPPMVAVLPFTFVGQSGDSEFFADGIHNDLLTQLAKLQSLRVISSTSVQEYRGSERNLRQIGEELGADVILEGSVQTDADQIRINAQLIDAHTDEHLWAESYDRALSPASIFDVQAEIAFAITEALHAAVTSQDSQQLAGIPTENMAAYKAYHRAMQMREKDAGAPNSQEYVDLLEEAVALDPGFSRAWAELVTALSFQNFSGDQPDLTRRAEQALSRLQEIAPGSADYLIGQGAYVYYTLKDYDRAHELISEAIRLNPSDVTAVQLRSWIERRQGDFDALVKSRREARRLDPRNPALTDELLMGLLVTHRFNDFWAESETSRFKSFFIGYAQALHTFQEQRDFGKLQESVQELCRWYDQSDCGWDEFVANRDYAAALNSLDRPGDEIVEQRFSKTDLRFLFTHWLMKSEALPEQKLQNMWEELERDKVDSDSFLRLPMYIAAALLAGIEGNDEEAERWIERWDRQQPIDWAERTTSRHEACRVLGMIEATHATVRCIRDGLSEPSSIIPFFEPYLPFYDSLRDKPEFIEMLIEIDGDASATTLY